LIASVGLLLFAPLMLLLPLFLCLVTILLRRLLCLLLRLLLRLLLCWLHQALLRHRSRTRGQSVRRLLRRRAMGFGIPGRRWGCRFTLWRRMAALSSRGSSGTV
jgi:hypothetical protein